MNLLNLSRRDHRIWFPPHRTGMRERLIRGLITPRRILLIAMLSAVAFGMWPGGGDEDDVPNGLPALATTPAKNQSNLPDCDKESEKLQTWVFRDENCAAAVALENARSNDTAEHGSQANENSPESPATNDDYQNVRRASLIRKAGKLKKLRKKYWLEIKGTELTYNVRKKYEYHRFYEKMKTRTDAETEAWFDRKIKEEDIFLNTMPFAKRVVEKIEKCKSVAQFRYQVEKLAEKFSSKGNRTDSASPAELQRAIDLFREAMSRWELRKAMSRGEPGGNRKSFTTIVQELHDEGWSPA